MKKFVSTLVIACVPAFAFATGQHQGEHAVGGHHMSDHNITTMSGIGRPGDPTKVDRTIEVVMDDTMKFSPAQIEVKAGETIQFLITNSGNLDHEMVIGPLSELKAHAEDMKNTPGMQHVEPNMITLKPGQRGDLVWTFDQTGTVDFACLIPGHMEAGMVGKVKVN